MPMARALFGNVSVFVRGRAIRKDVLANKRRFVHADIFALVLYSFPKRLVYNLPKKEGI